MEFDKRINHGIEKVILILASDIFHSALSMCLHESP